MIIKSHIICMFKSLFIKFSANGPLKPICSLRITKKLLLVWRQTLKVSINCR